MRAWKRNHWISEHSLNNLSIKLWPQGTFSDPELSTCGLKITRYCKQPPRHISGSVKPLKTLQCVLKDFYREGPTPSHKKQQSVSGHDQPCVKLFHIKTNCQHKTVT